MSTIKSTKKEISPKIKIITLLGEVDESNIDALKAIINPFLEDNTKKLIINIKELEYINSMVIGWFASLIADFADKNKSFVFSEPNDDIFDIIDLVGLTEAIETYDNNEEALLSFEK